jgi:hypothetical protein
VYGRFNLSFPGRINIAKTMLYSQINYLGCFLPVPLNLITTWENLITGFVKGKLNIARNRLFKPPVDGGIGLFDIHDFLDSQKCAWIRRSNDLAEPWKVSLYFSNFGCVYNSKSRNIIPEEYPILNGICRSYERMINHFTTVNENFTKCYIFENEKITKTLESREQLSRNLFSVEFFNANACKLYKLRYCDFYTEEGETITREQLKDNVGIDLTVLQYFEMRNACNIAKIRFRKKEPNMQSSVDIETYINRRKRGSSHLRKLFSFSLQSDIPHNIRIFADNMDIIITGEQSRVMNGLWTDNIYTNEEKTFLFKLHNNTLGYNNMVAHFVRGHSPFCTFCTITNDNEQHMETPSHLFFDCPSVVNIIDGIFYRVTGDNNFVLGRRDFFTTFDYRELSCAKNKILTIVGKYLMKYIWDCKTRQFLPDLEHCWDTVRDKIEFLTKSNSSVRTMWNSTNYSLRLVPP